MIFYFKEQKFNVIINKNKLFLWRFNMGKKKAKLPLIYLIGVALITLGFCVPMFRMNLGPLGSSTSNGFEFINFDNSSFVTIGALLIFIGGVAGILSCFVSQLSKLKLIFLIVSIVGGVILILGFTTNGTVYKFIGEHILKYAYIGFYMVIAGWIVGLIGVFSKK